MRTFRSLLVLVCLCLCLGASVASAAEAPSRHATREIGGLARIVGQLGAFLKAVWENDAGCIDPFGKSSPTVGASTDDAGYIDPLGKSSPNVGTSTDDAGYIDPWGGR